MLKKFDAEKKKQYLYITGAFLAIAAAVILFGSVFSEDTKKQIIETPNIKIVDAKDMDAKAFRKDYGDELSDIRGEMSEVKKQNQALSSMMEASKNNGMMPPQQNGVQGIVIPPPLPPGSITPPPTIQNNNVGDAQKPPMPPQNIVMSNMIGTVDEVPESTGGNRASKKNNAPIKKPMVIPAGSFMGGMLLNGLDAPTGGKAKSSPHPVLIKITNLTKLPNRFKADLKECFVVGSGYGDLSSERAFARLEKLSCMTKEGEAVEVGITGYIAGEDGKVGMLGRVVSKQGSILARTMAAGFLQGVADGFSMGTTTMTATASGVVSMPNPGDTLTRGLAGGASEATKKLADFYMKLANEMFPVIEINAGRKVDVVLLEKMSFDTEVKK